VRVAFLQQNKRRILFESHHDTQPLPSDHREEQGRKTTPLPQERKAEGPHPRWSLKKEKWL